MSGGSGLLDVERRVEQAALERLRGFTDLTGLLSGGTVVVRRDAAAEAVWPSAYAEGYNFAEFGLHTGNYLGGLRLGGLTYADDDTDRSVSKQILGAFRMWAQQEDLKSLLNGTTSAQTFGSEVWFFSAELDPEGSGMIPAYIVPSEWKQKANECVLELTVVCMPSRP